MSRILLLTAHSIAEYDDLRMLSELGHEVFSIGAYTDPAHPTDDKRPPLDVPYFPELALLVDGDQMAHKQHLPDDLIDWSEVIIAHHFVYDWIAGQWGRIRDKRVIWRTCGQSNPDLEGFMRYLRPEGLQIVRYSPLEGKSPISAGADAIIRFGKEPADWYGWEGNLLAVGNVTQDMLGRAEATGHAFWEVATRELAVAPAGPMSQDLRGGVGNLDYEELRAYLRSIRVMLYTGTLPAPYTLGLIEAMMTGTPTVSIGPRAWARGVDWLEPMFEATYIAGGGFDDPAAARTALIALLNDEDYARDVSKKQRERAIALFGMDVIKQQWAAFLR
jgi:hypothetical protein